MSHNISAIMSQRDTDRTPEAQAAREAGLTLDLFRVQRRRFRCSFLAGLGGQKEIGPVYRTLEMVSYSQKEQGDANDEIQVL